MPLDATLLEMLACPSDDHAPLREETRDGSDVLVCSFCESSYPMQDGIPVLLLDEVTPGPHGVGVDAGVETPPVEPASDVEPDPRPARGPDAAAGR